MTASPTPKSSGLPSSEQGLSAAEKALLTLIIGQLALWSLIPWLVNNNLPLDVIREGLSWGREWQLGYHKHPPLPSWMVNGAFEMLGDLGPYLLSQLSIITAYLFIFLLGRRILSEEAALLATMITAAIFYYNWPTPEYNHNIAQIPLWAMAIYGLHRAFIGGKPWGWYLTGLAMALGILSKYTILLLGPVIFFYMLAAPEARRQFLSPHPYLAAIMAVILISPHLYWLIEHDFLPFRYYEGRSASEAPDLLKRLLNPLKFLLAQIADHLPTLLAMSLAGLLTKNSLRHSATDGGAPPEHRRDGTTDQNRRFLLIFLAGPVLLAAIWSLITGDKLRSMWGAPLWSLSAITALYFLNPPVSGAAFHSATKRLLAFLALIPLIYGAAALITPHFSKKPSRTNWPASEMSAYFTEQWQKNASCPLTIISGDNWLTGLIAHRLSPRPSVLIDGNLTISPWVTKSEIREQGMLIIWQAERERPPQPVKTPAMHEVSGTAEFPWPRNQNQPPLSLQWQMQIPETCQNTH